MPSKLKQIQFRLSWLRQQKGDKADAITKAIMEHPSIKAQIEVNYCPICKQSFEDCEYFQNLENS